MKPGPNCLLAWRQRVEGGDFSSFWQRTWHLFFHAVFWAVSVNRHQSRTETESPSRVTERVSERLTILLGIASIDLLENGNNIDHQCHDRSYHKAMESIVNCSFEWHQMLYCSETGSFLMNKKKKKMFKIVKLFIRLEAKGSDSWEILFLELEEKHKLTHIKQYTIYSILLILTLKLRLNLVATDQHSPNFCFAFRLHFFSICFHQQCFVPALNKKVLVMLNHCSSRLDRTSIKCSLYYAEHHSFLLWESTIFKHFVTWMWV